jgi:hypothetical protein
MKKIIFLFFAVLVITGCTPPVEEIDVAKEEEAIKAVIEGEINASFDGDYETWTNFFAHKPYTFWLQAGQGGYVCWKGWEEISSNGKDFIKPERPGSAIYAGSYDYTIKVYKNAALVTFKTKITAKREGESINIDGIEVRSLEKQNGEWKITYLGTVRPATYEDAENEEDDDD